MAIGQGFNFKNVPLDTMVDILARDVGDNFIMSPGLAGNVDANGRPVRKPMITYQGDATANELLAKILKEHGLVMLKDPVTTVTRIAYTNEPVRKANARLLAGDTSAPLPEIVFDMAPLDICLNYIAKSGKMTLVIDPQISNGTRTPDGKLVSPPLVSVRWTNLTARQAMLALCLNFDLSLAADGKTGAWRITLKP